jgi:hypothetical protein
MIRKFISVVGVVRGEALRVVHKQLSRSAWSCGALALLAGV